MVKGKTCHRCGRKIVLGKNHGIMNMMIKGVGQDIIYVMSVIIYGRI